jgi:flagellar basal-body rod modification protein FlgD
MADSISGLSLDSLTGAYSKYSNTTVDTSSGDSTSSYMDFDSYLKVLAAQMSNQDFNDPMSDSEMLQQMASYSMLEGIKNMTNQSTISYASSLVGKAITVNNNGTYDTGIVDSVVVDNSTPYLMINGDMYEVDNVTNIADSDTYNKLSLLVGYEVNASTGTEGVYKTGTVTNVLIIGGEGYVVLDGSDMYSLSDISLKSTESSSTSSDSDSASSADTDTDTVDETKVTTDTEEDGITASADETDGDSEAVSASLSSDDDDIVTAYNTVSDTVEGASYMAQSQALFNELMSTIDSISGHDDDDDDIVVTEASVTPNLSGYENVTISYVSTPDYAAGTFASDDETLEVLASDSGSVYNTSYSDYVNGTSSEYMAGLVSDSDSYLYSTAYTTSGTYSSGASDSYVSSTSGTSALRSGNYDLNLTADNLDSVAASARNGRVSSILTNSQVRSILNDDDYQTRYSTRYGLEVQSDTNPGISTSDCEPHRISGAEENYSAETALADSLGTRMYDVRFINNTAITSRIDTSTVIGTTISGKEVTEIGYSGVGRLGEVVTFKDGTQRVEVLLNSGNSCWLTTSGDYTLDEICDTTAAPGSLSDLTPFEVAIRNYSKQSAPSAS